MHPTVYSRVVGLRVYSALLDTNNWEGQSHSLFTSFSWLVTDSASHCLSNDAVLLSSKEVCACKINQINAAKTCSVSAQ